MAGLVFLLVSWVLAGACQRHGVDVFLLRNSSSPCPRFTLTPGHFALRICAVDLKNAPETAETLDKIKQCLEASQISVEVENIKIKPLRARSTSTLQDLFVVARLLPKASKMMQLLCNGPAGAHRQLFDLKEIDGIPSKGAYDPRSKLAKLPFNGAKFSTMVCARCRLSWWMGEALSCVS